MRNDRKMKNYRKEKELQERQGITGKTRNKRKDEELQ